MVRRVGYDPFFAWARTTVILEVSGDGASFLARVRLVDDAGLSRGARELRSGPSGCQGLIDAAALAISIALDIDTPAPVEPPPAPEPPAPPPPPPPTPEPPPPTPVTPGVVEVPDRTPVASTQRSLRVLAGLDALASVGATPNLVPGLGLWAGVRTGTFLVDLEASADTADTALFAPRGQASLQLLTAGLASCDYVGSFFLCAVGDVSWLHAAGSDVALPKSGSAVGVALGPRVGLELPIARSLAFRARVDGLVNVVRPRVAMDSAEWSVPLFGAVLAAGVAYRFP